MRYSSQPLVWPYVLLISCLFALSLGAPHLWKALQTHDCSPHDAIDGPAGRDDNRATAARPSLAELARQMWNRSFWSAGETSPGPDWPT